MAHLPAATIATTAADVARRVPGVVDLDAGPLGTKVTYGSSGRIAGVTVRSDEDVRTVTVYLSVQWGPVSEIAEQVMASVLDAVTSAYPDAGPWQVDVVVADIVTAEDHTAVDGHTAVEAGA